MNYKEVFNEFIYHYIGNIRFTGMPTILLEESHNEGEKLYGYIALITSEQKLCRYDYECATKEELELTIENAYEGIVKLLLTLGVRKNIEHNNIILNDYTNDNTQTQ